jgi:hypothetical protein
MTASVADLIAKLESELRSPYVIKTQPYAVLTLEQCRDILEALQRPAHEPPAVPDLHQVLRRVLEAVQALGAMEDGKTLFESSPSKSKAAFDAWLMLNQAVAKANYVLEQPASPQPPTPSPLAKVAAAFAGKVKDSYILKLWFESQEDLDAAFNLVDDVNPILPVVPDSDPTKGGEQS